MLRAIGPWSSAMLMADHGATNIQRRGSNFAASLRRPASPSPAQRPDKDPATGVQRNFWFALYETKPCSFLPGYGRAGMICRLKDGQQDHQLFAFFTTDPNGVVRPIHDKAMPAILTKQGEIETWLTAPWDEARICNGHFPTRCCGWWSLLQRSRHNRQGGICAPREPSQRTGIVEHWCAHAGCKGWGSFGHQTRMAHSGFAWSIAVMLTIRQSFNSEH